MPERVKIWRSIKNCAQCYQTDFSSDFSGWARDHFHYAEEGVQAYGGSYSSVTYSGNIRNEIGVMRFPCNEIAMSD